MRTIMKLHSSLVRYFAQMTPFLLVGLAIGQLITGKSQDLLRWPAWVGYFTGILFVFAIASLLKSHKKFDVTLSETTLCAPRRTGSCSFQRTEVPIRDLDLKNSRISRFRESYVMTNEGQKLIIASGYHSMRSIRTLYGKIDEAIRHQRLS